MNWSQHGFVMETTADGSPTLRLAGGTGEAMHHSGGALEESLYIYGAPAREVFARVSRPRVFSLGLGLGYNEWIVAALSEGRAFSMVTMESEVGLRSAFMAFLREGVANVDLEAVRDRVASALGVDPLELHRRLASADWTLLGALGSEFPTGRFHYFMYDAFSGETSPLLWQQEFLSSFLEVCSENICAFSTYACRGSLKRALDGAGFVRVEREGFKGKRNSTLAWRG